MPQMLLTNPEFDLAEIEQYFAPSYRQTVNGLELGYAEFVAHVAKLKEDTKNRRCTEACSCSRRGACVYPSPSLC